jgi:hypothetical protein
MGIGNAEGNQLVYITHGLSTSSTVFQNLDYNRYFGNPVYGFTYTYPINQNNFILNVTAASTIIYLSGTVYSRFFSANSTTGIPALTGYIKAIRIG